MSTETEYHVQPGKAPDSDTTRKRLAAEKIVIVTGGYCSNGARIYPEFGIEYAAPECLGPSEAADFDFDGITIIRRLTGSRAPLLPGEKAEESDATEKFKTSDSTRFPVLRHTGSYNFYTGARTTRGYHQNFLTPYPEDSRKRELLKAVIGSFLATRIIWDGSGFVTNEGYLLSQKATGIGTAVVSGYGNRTQHGFKPLAGFMGRNENAGDKIHEGWGLLEVRCADAHMSKTQIETSGGAVSLVLRLIERGVINEGNADDYILPDPVKALHEINKNYGHACLRLASGKFTSALSLQRAYAEAMRDMPMIEDLPLDERRVIPRLLTIYDQMGTTALRTDADLRPLVRNVEQAAKLHYLQKKLGENACKDRLKEAVAFDMQWHRIDDRSVGLMVYNNLDPRNLEQSHGKRAPADTRAAARGKAIASKKVSSASWNKVTMLDGSEIEFDDYWDPVLHTLPRAA